MSAKANYFKIGIFVISAAVIGIIAIVALGVGTFFQKKLILETYIDGSVQGLDVGSPFKFRGVKLGNVDEITFVNQEYKFDPNSKEYLTYGQHVLVKIAIEPTRDITEKEQRQFMERMIAKGLRVRLAAQGITGVAYLEADYVDPERYPPPEIKWEPKTYYVPSVPSTISELTVSVDKILNKLEEINIKGITDGIEDLLTEVRETNKKVGPLISNASETMASVQEIVEDSKEPLTNSLTALEELPEILTKVKHTLRRFNNVLSSEEQNIEESTENVRLITGNLRDLTESARKYSSQLIFGEPPPHSQPGGSQ
jgi:phospholipid/cholesterol/gamma-HCH transport system substrate-binding protein/paraquat-inducible protein B